MIFKNISNFNNVNDYLPILNAIIIVDLFVILLSNINIIKSEVLQEWYKKYNLSAVIADVLIIMIGFIIARFFYKYLFTEYNFIYFILLLVIVQVIHDYLFYLLISSTPKKMNKIFDFFKLYAKESSYKAIIFDSLMMIFSCLFASLLAFNSLNINIIILIFLIYLIPYFIYTN